MTGAIAPVAPVLTTTLKFYDFFCSTLRYVSAKIIEKLLVFFTIFNYKPDCDSVASSKFCLPHMPVPTSYSILS